MKSFPQVVLCLVFFLNVSLGDEFDSVRKRIERELRQRQIPSLAIGVARDGKILWEEGFGWADRENRRKANEHTMYSLASISKPITATGIMLLVQEDKLSLDRRANAYLGNASLTAHLGKVESATVRLLANHTSGLPLHYQFFYEDGPHRRPHMDESIRRYGHLVTPPGEHYQYANFGYGLLDHIIHLRSNQTYASFMKQRVFLPLGMHRTSIYIEDGLKDHAAVRYAPDQSRLPLYEFDHPGASAVYSSAHDILRFGMLHVGTLMNDQREILRDGYVKEMQTPTTTISPGSGYGVGWRITENASGYRTVSHTGGMPGVSTRLTLVPDEKIVVTALCNKSERLPHDIVPVILDILLPKRKENREKQAKTTKLVKKNTTKTPLPKLLTPGYYEGTIDTYSGKRQLKLWVPKSDSAWPQIQIDTQLRTLVNGASVRDGILRGVFHSNIGTSDAARRPYQLHLKLFLRKDGLNGSVTVLSNRHPQKGNDAVSHWCELKRVSDISTPLSLFDGSSMKHWEVIKKNDFERHGKVSLTNKAIEIGAGRPASGVRFTGPFPKSNYQVMFEAQRMKGSDFFCGVTFPVGDSFCTMICGGWGGGITGLSNIDNMSAVENETTHHVDFKNGQWYPIRIRVTDDAIKAWVGAEKTVDIKRKDRKFSIWWEQEPVRPFGIASWNTKAAVRNVVLTHP